MNYTSNVKEALLKKTPFQLKENGKAIDFRPALERSLAFKDFDNDDSAIKLIYPEAWKRFKNQRWTLQIHLLNSTILYL